MISSLISHGVYDVEVLTSLFSGPQWVTPRVVRALDSIEIPDHAGETFAHVCDYVSDIFSLLPGSPEISLSFARAGSDVSFYHSRENMRVTFFTELVESGGTEVPPVVFVTTERYFLKV